MGEVNLVDILGVVDACSNADPAELGGNQGGQGRSDASVDPSLKSDVVKKKMEEENSHDRVTRSSPGVLESPGLLPECWSHPVFSRGAGVSRYSGVLSLRGAALTMPHSSQ
ncbi:unnamed protein product [Gadus morhua 'NCC']